MTTSSVSRATSAPRSADSHARTNFATIAWELEGGHEGQGDRLGLLVTGLRAQRHAGPTPEERAGERLEPDDLADPGRQLSQVRLGYLAERVAVPELGGPPGGYSSADDRGRSFTPAASNFTTSAMRAARRSGRRVVASIQRR
jgi:hypothetical protein